MTKLTTEFLSKLQDSLLQFQDSYSDPADKENYGIFVDALHVLDEFKAAKEKLIAYEQAAEKPYGYLEPCDFPRTTATVYPEKDKYAFMPLYAAPVLPKQPEHSRQQFESLCNQFWNWAEFDEINHDEDPLLEWNGSNYTNRVTAALWKMYQAAPAQPVIPEQALNTAKLINKFYERYPLETFANDNERAEALGYFMAGAELQCFGDFIAYDDHAQESE